MAANVCRVILKGKGKVKVKGVPSASSQLAKFLGIPNPPRSADTVKLISSFVKINNPKVSPLINPFTSSYYLFISKNVDQF